MTISDFFNTTPLKNSLLIGFYGGGNYGDELLLEIVQTHFHDRKIAGLKIYYQQPSLFSDFHQDFGYELVDGRSNLNLIIQLLKAKNVLIGGGGLWGMDANFKILLLGLILFLAKLLGKQVYLVGVGYYNSTNLLGKISAYFSGLAAKLIFARDQESYQNFRKINSSTTLANDLAFSLPDLNLKPIKFIKPINFELGPELNVVVSLRRFKDDRGDKYSQIINELVVKYPQIRFILILLEPKFVDPDGYKFIQQMGQFKNVRYYDFKYNPFALIRLFQDQADKLVLIGPQYHIIITAILTKVKFFPLVYDNKVSQLLKRFRIAEPVHISALTLAHLTQFIVKNNHEKKSH